MKKIRMQLFGTFFLTDGKAVLGEDQLHSNKLIRLLIYILLNRRNILTHRKLIEIFWDENSKNPEAALRNQMYLIRSELKALSPGDFICTRPGAYRWNPEIQVDTDYEEFEKMAASLKVSSDVQEKKFLCGKILECFRGNVTPRVADEAWILPKTVWYESAYLDAAKTLCKILEDQGEWERMEQVCSQVLDTYSFDEDIQCWMLVSLHHQKKYELMLDHYKKARSQLYENVGISRPEKLQNTFQKLLAEKESSAMGMEELLHEIREEQEPKGAFFCDFQIFRQIYQIEARRNDRNGTAEHMILFTIRGTKNRLQINQAETRAIRTLEQVISSSLRVSDVASRCSAVQMIVLLPMCSYESAVKVAERIKGRFCREIEEKGLELWYELAEVEAPAQRKERENEGRGGKKERISS